MRFMLALFLFVVSALGREWVIVSHSPDKQFAVAVFPHGADTFDEADLVVLLIDGLTGRRIGPLEKVDSSGGGYGASESNVDCEWSQDSSLLIVSFRCGRLMHASQVYRMKGRRAVPVSLPDAATHPKGRIMKVLTKTANPSSRLKFTKDGGIDQRVSGLIPSEGHWDDDFSKYGVGDFDDTLIFHYRFDQKGQLLLYDITSPLSGR